MSLAAGTKLGPYEIVSPIGAGGMGEVYRARDTTLKRDVALKVLPADFYASAERLARFQREAEVLASLDHPNIGQIHGIVEAQGARALALALIEGPTLADQIAAGPIPVEEALSIARQVIAALEYAHERGVVHRDLKPANIKINPDGVVKVLDFGLAKVLEDEPPASSIANSPTLTVGHTRAGVILGTAGYMSPEQAIGRPVDRRSDIFSFGAVLYEMLTGTRAFPGATTPDVIEAVVKKDPDWSKLPAQTAPAIEKLLRRCLTKDRKLRLQAIGEARIALESPSIEEKATPSPESRSLFGVLATVAAVLAIALAGVSWIAWHATRPVERPLVRLEVDLGADVALTVGSSAVNTVILSPDGTRLVYVSGTRSSLFTRRLDQPKATQLPGTDNAGYPFFSPDGQSVGFFTANKLNKISVEGGAVVPLADLSGAPGASWGPDGNIVVSGVITQGLVRVPQSGGALAPLTQLATGELVQADPQILPGGKAVLMVSYGTPPEVDKATIDVVTLDDHRRKTLVRGGTSPRYVPSGHLLYLNKSTLFAIPFDPDRLETNGTAVAVLDDVAHNPLSGRALALSFSGAGTLLYRRDAGGGTEALVTFQWLSPGGKKEPLLAKPGLYSSPHLSPDGERLALKLGDTSDIWVYDPQRDSMTRLTFGGPPNDYPIWTPDGRNIVFSSFGGGLMWTRADGAGQPQPLLLGKGFEAPWSFSPDGKRLAYVEALGAGQISTVSIDDQGGQLKAGKPEAFLKTKFTEQIPTFSPDGRWLAYVSNESGKDEVYVRAFPQPSSGQGGKWQISNAGGTAVAWSHTSHELIYQSGDRLMAVSYTVQGDSFVNDKPRVWIDKLGGTQWDLAPDGKRVLVLTPVAAPEAPKQEHTVVFLENFFDELRRRVPAGK